MHSLTDSLIKLENAVAHLETYVEEWKGNQSLVTDRLSHVVAQLDACLNGEEMEHHHEP